VGGLREIGEIGINVEVMPELGGDDGGEAAFGGESGERTWAHLAKGFSPVLDSGGVEVASAS
jgi:hypothetical protein